MTVAPVLLVLALLVVVVLIVRVIRRGRWYRMSDSWTREQFRNLLQ